MQHDCPHALAPPPRRVHPAPGRDAAEARRGLGGAMVDFSKREEVEAWLHKDGRREAALVFAARAALRAVPAMAGIVPRRTNRLDDKRAAILLPIFRVMGAPWVAAKYPSRGAELRDAATRATRRAAAAARVAGTAFLDAKESVPANLAALPLWADGPPQWAMREWLRLKTALLAREDEHWEVWTDWYEARLFPDRHPAPSNPSKSLAR